MHTKHGLCGQEMFPVGFICYLKSVYTWYFVPIPVYTSTPCLFMPLVTIDTYNIIQGGDKLS